MDDVLCGEASFLETKSVKLGGETYFGDMYVGVNLSRAQCADPISSLFAAVTKRYVSKGFVENRKNDRRGPIKKGPKIHKPLGPILRLLALRMCASGAFH